MITLFAFAPLGAPAAPQVSIIQPNCSVTTGTVTVTDPVGLGLSYSLDGGIFQSAVTFNNVASGNHTITAKNLLNCESLATTVSIDAAPTIPAQPTVTVIQPNCTVQTGRFTVNTPTNMEYSIDGVNYQASPDFNDLIPGTYQLTVRNASGCVSPALDVIIDAIPQSIVLTETHVDPTCGNTNGSINITVNNGKAPFVYSWSSGEATEDIIGKSAGNYSLTVTDANNCTQTINVTLNNTNGPVITVDAQTNIKCNGSKEGSINISATGTGVLLYQWTGPNGFSSTNEDLAALEAGDYQLSVTDQSNCTSTASFSITESSPISIAETHINSTCGTASGAINLTVTGGVAPYSYSWSSGETTQNLTAKMADNYTVTVTDANSCVRQLTINITNTDGPIITVNNQVNNKCNGDNTGSIDITVNGNGLIYQWTGPNGFTSTNADLINLSAGNYQLVVTDANNCVGTLSVEITEPDVFLITETHIDPTCGNSTGSISIQPSGGTSPYSYLWNNGSILKDLTALSAGTYSVVVKDANGCEKTISVGLIDAAGPSATVDVTNVCNGKPEGTIIVNAHGGKTPLSYSLDGVTFQSSPSFGNLSAGNYSVIIKDANSCQTTVSTAITAYPIIVADAVITPAGCNGEFKGAAQLTVSGGVPPFLYKWSGPNSFTSTNKDISAVQSGIYQVVITDATSCELVMDVNINESPTLNVKANIINAACNGTPTGLIDIDVSGGRPPYKYSWSNGSSAEDLKNLSAGLYTLTVTDANSCDAILQAMVGVVEVRPKATDDQYSGLSNQNITGNVNLNDADLDGSIVGNTVLINPQHGTVTLTNNGSFTYSPVAGFAGIDSFDYYVTDDCGLRDTAKVTINISLVNAAPLALNDNYATTVNVPLIVPAVKGALLNDNDPNNDPITAQLVQQPLHGKLVFNADGSFTYTPDKDFVGTDTFTYTVSDGKLTSQVATVTIVVTDKPIDEMDVAITKVAEDKSVGIDEEFSYTITADNLSTIDVTDVMVKDELPEGLEYVDAFGSKGDVSYDQATRTLTWQLSQMTAGERQTLTLKVKVKQIGTFTNTATISAPGKDKNLKNNVSTARKTILGFTIPNAFSPNNDGVNDLFVIKGIETMDSELHIYNRYGDEVYLKRNYQNDWDGSSLPQATYYYVIKIRGEKNTIQSYAGAITIVR